MTFNIRGDFDQGRATDKSEAWNSRSGKHRRDLLLKLITDIDADILGVQEAYHNQVEDLEQALPGHTFYGVGRDDGEKAGECSGVLFRNDRFNEVDHGTFWLSESPDRVGSAFPGAACVRIASWNMLTDGMHDDRQLFVLNTHWDHVSQKARVHSAGVIREKLAALAERCPVIVMGDLNAFADSEAVVALGGAEDDSLAAPKLHDSYRQAIPEQRDDEATYHNFMGFTKGLRIDFILTSGDFRATDAKIIHTCYDGVYPSDHYPVVVTLELLR
jgi:endonuclease/exonuclease/phosphatase family metal-dependent hydrolase